MSILLKKISFIFVLWGLSFPVYSGHSHQNRFPPKTKHFSQQRYKHFPKPRHSARHRHKYKHFSKHRRFTGHGHFPKHRHFPRYNHFPTCNPYTHSSVCRTHSGNTCTSFVRSYQPAWFSSCMGDSFIHLCINLPTLPVPIVQNVCYPIGTPCTCVLDFFNGHIRYDAGIVL